MRSFRHTALVALSVALVACSAQNPQKHVVSARLLLEKDEPRAAIIELKNALQLAPDLAEARVLLGTALLDSGNPASAAVELRKARDLKYDDSQVVPKLARAMLASGQSKQVIDEFGNLVLPVAAAMADLKASLAAAYSVGGDADAARREIAAALKADPESTVARLAEVRAQFANGDVDAAVRSIDAMLAKTASDPEAWILKAQLLRAQKADTQRVLDAYRTALGLRKSFFAAHGGIVGVLLEQRQTDAAEAQLAQMKKYWPDSIHYRWFEAQVAFQRRDLAKAARLTEQLLSIAPNDVRFLYLAGSVGLAKGSTLQAEYSLSKALQLAPDNEAVRRLLAAAQLRLGQPAKAIKVLQPLLDNAGPAAETFAVAARIHLALGDRRKAEELFASAIKLNPTDFDGRTALAVLRLSKDAGNDGLRELLEISAADPGVTADLRIVAELSRRKDFDAALKAIDALEKKQSDAPLPNYLRGAVMLAKKDAPAARSSFEKAIARDPKYYPAIAALCALDIADKKPEVARKRLEQLLAADPKNMRATLGLIDLRRSAGATHEELIELLNKAVALDPSEPTPKLLLVEELFKSNDVKRALMVAQAGVAALPDNARLLDALARAQVASGDRSQAIASYTRLAALQPQSLAPHLGLANIYMEGHNTEAARQSFRRALALDATSLKARSGLVALELDVGNRQAALEAAQALQKLLPREPAGYLLEGDAHLVSKNWAAASAVYQKAYALDPSSVAAIKIHSTWLAATEQSRADAFAQARVRDFPKDSAFMFHLAEIALIRKQYAIAEARYADVVKLEPSFAVAYNNLAWLMVEQKKKGGLAYAEKAASLQPEQPSFVDTLASALAFEGQIDKALTLQRKLVESNSERQAFRLHLAQLYVQAGKLDKAKTELERLSALGDKLTEKDEVARLLKAL